jgi:hypothetical protein
VYVDAGIESLLAVGQALAHPNEAMMIIQSLYLTAAA